MTPKKKFIVVTTETHSELVAHADKIGALVSRLASRLILEGIAREKHAAEAKNKTTVSRSDA